MIGILKRIIVVDLQENNIQKPMILINPEITWRSSKLQVFNEASICFPGIAADISRSKAIKVSFLDYEGKIQEFEVEGFLSSVLKHEIDYFDGKIFLDHLSKLKSDMLLKKMQKHMKLNPAYIHGAGVGPEYYFSYYPTICLFYNDIIASLFFTNDESR